MDKNGYAVKQYFALGADWLILFAMNKEVLQNIITIAERLPTDGHSLCQKDVADIINTGQWIVCFEWFDDNARDCVIPYKDHTIQAKSSVTKETLLARLSNIAKEVGKSDYERKLNIRVMEDTLKHNRTTRLIAWLAFGVSILALLVSVFVPLLIRSENQ